MRIKPNLARFSWEIFVSCTTWLLDFNSFSQNQEQLTTNSLEFSLNVFTELFSDKTIKNQKGGLQGWNPGPPVQETRDYHSATGNKQILIVNPIHASVISQILHLEKTPLGRDSES